MSTNQQMNIGRKDVVWNFAGTFMRVASGLIILPIVLRTFPKDEFGLWTIFLAVGAVASLLDFGFSNAFGRNITYIFSGVKKLQTKGYNAIDKNDKAIDFSLLKSVIHAMRKYYAILGVLFLLIFLTISPFYLPHILTRNNYSGNHNTVWIAWLLYGVMVSYQLYTYYYSALLMGRGMVKQNQQAIIIGQSVRILIIYILVLFGHGIVALVIGQFLGDFITRSISYFFFYDKNLKSELKKAVVSSTNHIMKIMMPNAIRIGITSLGGFLVVRAAVPIASLYLPLDVIGSYGLTKQIIDLIVAIGSIWFGTYYPKITSFRVNNDITQLKRMYLKGKFSLLFIFLISGIGLVLFGDFALSLIKSQTQLLPVFMTSIMLLIAFLEANHAMSGNMLLTKNEVPFAKASVLSGLATVLLLFIGLKFLTLGVWVMILAPGIAQGVYQNWKWPLEVVKDIHISYKDYWINFKQFVTQFH